MCMGEAPHSVSFSSSWNEGGHGMLQELDSSLSCGWLVFHDRHLFPGSGIAGPGAQAQILASQLSGRQRATLVQELEMKL